MIDLKEEYDRLQQEKYEASKHSRLTENILKKMKEDFSEYPNGNRYVDVTFYHGEEELVDSVIDEFKVAGFKVEDIREVETNDGFYGAKEFSHYSVRIEW